MDNHNNYQNNYYEYRYAKGQKDSKDINWPSQSKTSNQKGDEDLIIEENTIYEIDRECVERLKRKKNANIRRKLL